MPLLDLSPHELLTTTRAVRRRLDLTRPVAPALIRECLEVALQGPSGGNAQGWHWVVVTDPAQRLALAEVYRRAFAAYRAHPSAARQRLLADPARAPQQERVMASADHLAEHLHEVPVLLVPCLEGRLTAETVGRAASFWGSLLPAVWNFMLAARLRGLGTCWTSLHLVHEREAAEVLGIPYERVSQGALIPVAHTLGTAFRPARRESLDDVLHQDRW